MGAVVSNKKLWSLKKKFAKNVAAMHRHEVYGLKPCGDISWECLFKDYMIINTLSCHTGEVLTQMDVNCLANKVTHECNC